MTLEQPYRGDPLPLYPEMENARGKVNIVIFSGKNKVPLRFNTFHYKCCVIAKYFVLFKRFPPSKNGSRGWVEPLGCT